MGIYRSHGCSCGGCQLGPPDYSLDVPSPDDSLGRALCPTRAAARQVINARELWEILSADGGTVTGMVLDDFPPFPNLEGQTL